MGESKLKNKGIPVRSPAVTVGERGGTSFVSPPTVNTGEGSQDRTGVEGNQSEPNRARLNLSLGSELRNSLDAAASVLGISSSQLVHGLIVEALPTIAARVQAVRFLNS
jgi:hypothetical protein